MNRKFVALFAFSLTVAFESAFASPFSWTCHEQLYVPSKNNTLVFNKALPKDNIRVFNFEAPVHVYMRLRIVHLGETYESDIFPFYKKEARNANSHLLNPMEMEIKDIIEDTLKKNGIAKDANIVVYIDLASKDIENESVVVDFSNNDICIRNVKVPADISAMFN